MKPVDFYFFCNNLLDAWRKFSHNGIYETKNAKIDADGYSLQTFIFSKNS